MKCILAVLFCLPMTLGAQDTTQAPPDTARPFVKGGVYDKPYQARLLGRTAIGGYAEAHARWQEAEGLKDDAGFELKRFNLFTSTKVSDWVRIGSELEFEDGGQQITIEYAAIDLSLHTALTLRAGLVLSPLGRFNLAHDSPRNEFTDRPIVSTDLLGVALTEPGFGLLGRMSVPRGGRLTWEAYATNGFHDGLITSSENGTRIPLGRRNFEDNNGTPAFVGRIAWSPSVQHEIGISAHHGAYNIFNLEGTTIDERRNLTIRVLDVETSVMGFQLAGEGMIASINISPGLRGIYADRQHGWYVEGLRELGRGLVRTIPNSVFAVKARWDLVDFDSRIEGRSRSQITLGANFRVTSETVIKFDYVRGRGRDDFNNLAKHVFVLGSIATYF